MFDRERRIKNNINRIRKIKRKYKKTSKGKATEKKYIYSDKGKISARRKQLKYLYGITLEEHQQMYVNQNGRCLLCDSLIDYRDIVTDHNHITGKVRGLLCRPCNARLGWFENRKDTILEYIGD